MNFIKVDINQEGPEWHLFRSKGFGGTDAGIILGLNPYETVSSIFEAKTDPEYIKEFSDSGIAAMQHGKNLEDVARKTFESIIGLEFSPTCAIHNKYSFIRSSLDGISADYSTLLEIKCPYRYVNFEKHCNGILPYYYAQAQHQLLTTNSKILFFASYFQDELSTEVVIYKVFPDVPLQKELTSRCVKLWKSIQNKKTPSPFTYYNYELKNICSEIYIRKKLR